MGSLGREGAEEMMRSRGFVIRNLQQIGHKHTILSTIIHFTKPKDLNFPEFGQYFLDHPTVGK